MLKTEAIREFLILKSPEDLAQLYHAGMEVQVNVSQGRGEKVTGEHNGHKWQGWSDGITTWKNMRIPFRANSEPEFTDSAIKFDLLEHAEGIGCTGWDWKARRSRWVAFDFDDVLSHVKGLTDSEMQAVQDAACSIPWVTVRRSTSGNGLHLYVFVDEETNTHTEHAALARAILSKMSALVGFDFSTRVDCCGSNIWIWHRKFERVGGKSGPGLKLIKMGTQLVDIPINWRDHIKVTSGQRKKILPGFIDDARELTFEELCGQNTKVPLDTEHKALIAWLDTQARGSAWWDSDHYLLVAHTSDLKNAHTDLGMRGIFDTVAKGNEQGDQNCWLVPLRKGAWCVRRHTPGVQEHHSWEQDTSGWTRCYLNRDPDLRTAARSHGGNENEKGGFNFREVEMALAAAATLGAITNVPRQLEKVPAILKPHKDGRLVLEVDAPPEPGVKAIAYERDMYAKFQAELASAGWVQDKKKYKLVFGAKTTNQTDSEIEVGSYDDIVRHVVSESGENRGWLAKSDGTWVVEPLEHVRAVLLTQGVKQATLPFVIGSCITRKWTLVNKPFQPEYPGDRKWNRGAAQLAYAPSVDIDNLQFPTWNAILDHTGSGLDTAININKWCRDFEIKTGGDYLRAWVASMIQQPLQPLPYLFLYGPQGSGKSIFHEAVSLLMSRGVMRADYALINDAGFNAELESVVLAYIEETDLRGNKSKAYNRIKDYVTSLYISIHQKGCTPYMSPNSTHWVQCANDPENCPVFPGDTRITMCYVPTLTDPMPKPDLLAKLRKEAPDFLAWLLSYTLPKSNDRLNLPIIETEDKKRAQEQHRTEVEAFIADKMIEAPGYAIKYSDLFDLFQEWLDPSKVALYTKIKFGREIPMKYPKGRMMSDGAQWYIGNLSVTPQPKSGKCYALGGDSELILKDA